MMAHVKTAWIASIAVLPRCGLTPTLIFCQLGLPWLALVHALPPGLGDPDTSAGMTPISSQTRGGSRPLLCVPINFSALFCGSSWPSGATYSASISLFLFLFF